MSRVVCLKHPKYDGVESPELDCAVCCEVYLQKVRSRNVKRNSAATEFVPKTRDAVKATETPRKRISSLFSGLF